MITCTGTGTIEGVNEAVSAELPPEYGEVFSIAFGTPQDPDSLWIIPKNTGSVFIPNK